MAFNVLLLDGVSPACGEILRSRGINAVQPAKVSAEELLSIIPEYHGMIVRSATKVTREVLQAGKNLKVVGRAGVGIDNIDLKAATESGVLVMNTPDGNTISTAEHTCGLIMALSRNIPNAVQSLKEGRWDRKTFVGIEVFDKTLGIVGLGKIGSNVAKRMNAFGMKVIGYDPFTSPERALEMGVELVTLEELLKRSDFVTLHTPLTDKTKGLISMKNASMLKKGVRIVNCARGGIIEESDIHALLDSGVVAGMALDVYTSEPPTPELYEILKHPKLVTTPHLGASTEEAQEKVAEQMAVQLADALELKSFVGSLNGKSIALSQNKEVQPYLVLGEKLGSLAAQLAPANLSELAVTYAGKCAPHSEVLTDAILKGWLSSTTEDTINLINARFISESHGLKVQETATKSAGTFAELITIDLGKKAPYRKICATIFGENDFRIVMIDDFHIELKLDGDLVLYRNVDKPGMLAAVSSAFAAQDINIAALSLGRGEKGVEAITAVTVDKQMSPEDLKPIQGMKGVQHVVYVRL
jgi:D-3-phosphoglycerate dehydrogenase